MTRCLALRRVVFGHLLVGSPLALSAFERPPNIVVPDFHSSSLLIPTACDDTPAFNDAMVQSVNRPASVYGGQVRSSQSPPMSRASHVHKHR
jgi:hypothetical protein